MANCLVNADYFLADCVKVENYEEPTVDELSGREGTICTVVTLPLVERNDSHIIDKCAKKGAKKGAKKEEVEKRNRMVLDAIIANPSAKNALLEQDLSLTKRQLDLALKKLQEDKKIHRENGNRKGKWIID